MQKIGFATVLFVFFSLTSAMAASTGNRVEIPIKQIRLNGVLWYSIPIQIGSSAPVDAMLDTGSTGVRIFPGVAASSDYSSTGHRADNSWPGAHDLWEGTIANAIVSIGGLASNVRVPIQVIGKVVCSKQYPDCPALKEDIQQYRMSGSFRAMIGVSMPSHHLSNDLRNPLIDMANAWIIELPLPSDPKPGRLIINPSLAEMAGFTLFNSGLGFNVGGARDNPLPGCLVQDLNGRAFCGPVILDNGTHQVTVITNEFPQTTTWAPGTTATLEFKNQAGVPIASRFTISPTNTETHVRLGRFPEFGQPPTRILAGTMAYLAYSVLFDYKNGKIGLKSREPILSASFSGNDKVSTNIPVNQGSLESCSPQSTAARILKSPHPNDLDPDWIGESRIGLAWSFSVTGNVTNDGISYKVGHLISPRGGIQTSLVYVLANEWVCNTTSNRSTLGTGDNSEQLRAACPVISNQYCANQTGPDLRTCIEQNRSKYANLSTACTKMLGGG